MEKHAQQKQAKTNEGKGKYPELAGLKKVSLKAIEVMAQKPQNTKQKVSSLSPRKKGTSQFQFQFSMKSQSISPLKQKQFQLSPQKTMSQQEGDQNLFKTLLKQILNQDIDNLKKILEDLMEKGWEIDDPIPVSKSDEKSLLHIFVDSFDPDLKVLKFLIENYKVNLNLVDCHGNTPYLKACKKGGLDKVIYLEEKGADVYARNQIGDGALSMAAYGGDLEIVKHLHSKKIFQIDEPNQEDQTALDIAQKKGHIDIVEYIVSLFEENDSLRDMNE